MAERTEGLQKVAVAFSGGLDSSVLAACARKRTEVLACSAYLEGASDEGRVRRAAEALGVRVAETRVTESMVRRELDAMDLPFEATVMDMSLWCLYSLVSRSAYEGGARVILLGQLADELFGGYAKYAEELKVNGERAASAMMTKDVADYAVRGRVRDLAACRRWVQPRLPFEDDRVRELGRDFPTSYKIRDGVRKAVLREAALTLGVPPELASTPKKAAQYSSGIQKVVARLAARKG